MLQPLRRSTDPVPFRIIQGCDYTYVAERPAGRKGHRYRCEGFIKNVNTHQVLVAMRALDGPDEGLQFCCTQHNVAIRYRLIKDPPPPEKVLRLESQGSGV